MMESPFLVRKGIQLGFTIDLIFCDFGSEFSSEHNVDL